MRAIVHARDREAQRQGAGGIEDPRLFMLARMSVTTTYRNSSKESVPNTCPRDIAPITGTGRGSNSDQTMRPSATRAETHAMDSRRRCEVCVMASLPAPPDWAG